MNKFCWPHGFEPVGFFLRTALLVCCVTCLSYSETVISDPMTFTSFHVSVCLSVAALAGATRTLRPQLRYQKKALDARIKIKDGIKLKFLSSKVMTVCSSPRIL